MERRAVLKLRKPPTRGMFFFSRKWSLSKEKLPRHLTEIKNSETNIT